MRWVGGDYYDDANVLCGWICTDMSDNSQWKGVLREPPTGEDRIYCDSADEARAWVEFALPYYRITGEIPTPEVWYEHRKEVI